MLTPVPVARVPHEWEAITAALKPAVERDPKHNMADLLHDAMRGALRLWKPCGEGRGYIATEAHRGVFSVIYVGGVSLGLRSMKRLLAALELAALRHKCSELRFEGRDWRRVCPDYSATLREDGRWRFSKRLT